MYAAIPGVVWLDEFMYENMQQCYRFKVFETFAVYLMSCYISRKSIKRSRNPGHAHIQCFFTASQAFYELVEQVQECSTPCHDAASKPSSI